MSRDIYSVAKALWREIPSTIPVNSALGRIRDYLDATVSSRASQSSISTIDGQIDTIDSALDSASTTLSTASTNISRVSGLVTDIDNELRTTNSEPSSQDGSIGSQVQFVIDNPPPESPESANILIPAEGLNVSFEPYLAAEPTIPPGWSGSFDVVHRPFVNYISSSLPNVNTTTKHQVIASLSKDIVIYRMALQPSLEDYIDPQDGQTKQRYVGVSLTEFILYSGAAGSEVAIGGVSAGERGISGSGCWASPYSPLTFVEAKMGTRLSVVARGTSDRTNVGIRVFYLDVGDFGSV